MGIFLEKAIPIIAIILECIGVFVILQGSIITIIKFIKLGLDYKEESLGLELAKAMALGLQFLLAAEILSTLIVRTLDQLWLLAGITILRIIIGLVLHWEINSVEK